MSDNAIIIGEMVKYFPAISDKDCNQGNEYWPAMVLKNNAGVLSLNVFTVDDNVTRHEVQTKEAATALATQNNVQIFAYYEPMEVIA